MKPGDKLYIVQPHLKNGDSFIAPSCGYAYLIADGDIILVACKDNKVTQIDREDIVSSIQDGREKYKSYLLEYAKVLTETAESITKDVEEYNAQHPTHIKG